MVFERHRGTVGVLFLCMVAGLCPWGRGQDSALPAEVPPRRSTQLSDGFGVNLPLPRDPRLPWNQGWWTRVFDTGVKWVRLGQYENSSEKTGWDWVEQSPGVYLVRPEVDEAVRSLFDNGVAIEMQLCYNNPLYQGNRNSRPKHVDPAPPSIGPGDKPPNPIFNGLSTEDEIQGFLNYTRFMVTHFKGKVRGWELWNEENIGYWQPEPESKQQLQAKATQYGTAFCRFADIVHKTDRKSKVIFGGTSSIDTPFVLAAISGCPSKIDAMAYHAYPGYGSNHAPEEVNALVGAESFREALLQFPGIRKDIEFWENEWNVSPAWKNSNDSVQARYLARYYLEAKAHGIKGFVWEFVPGTDGNEGDQFGLMHGYTNSADAFQPRESYRSFEVTSALFGQTDRDLSCEMPQDRNLNLPEQYSHGQLREYCFRDRVSGKRIYAAWLAVYASPEDRLVPVNVEIPIVDPENEHPIVIDVRTGKIESAVWRDKSARTISVDLKDSVVALADASYLNWPQAPAAPGGLVAQLSYGKVRLAWSTHEQNNRFEVQRSTDWSGWQTVTKLSAGVTTYSEQVPLGKHISYRVRALGAGSPSAWSNPAWVNGH